MTTVYVLAYVFMALVYVRVVMRLAIEDIQRCPKPVETYNQHTWVTCEHGSRGHDNPRSFDHWGMWYQVALMLFAVWPVFVVGVVATWVWNKTMSPRTIVTAYDKEQAKLRKQQADLDAQAKAQQAEREELVKVCEEFGLPIPEGLR
jgi:hypothetical protein